MHYPKNNYFPEKMHTPTGVRCDVSDDMPVYTGHVLK